MIARASLVLVASLAVLGLALAQGGPPRSRAAAADGGVVTDGGRPDAGHGRRRKGRRARARGRARDGGVADAGGEGEPGDGGVPLSLADRVADLETRVTALEQAQESLKTALDEATARIAALESARSASEAAAEAEAPRFDRAALLGGIVEDLESVLHTLSEGDTDGVDTTLNRDVTALGEVSTEATRLGRVLESRNADAASALLGDAIDAVGQSDLYRARILIGRAALYTRRAQSLAQTVTTPP